MQRISNAGTYYSGYTASPDSMAPQPQPSPDATAELLANACCRGDLGAVQSMIAAGCDVNAQTPLSGTVLSAAAQRGHRDIVAALLEAGADVNASSSEDGQTPLMNAAFSGSLDMMQTLIACPGIDLGHARRNGDNALRMAARVSCDLPIMCLLKAGASVIAPYDCRFEMLQQAIWRRNAEMARLIIEQCASEGNAFDRWRQPALILAAKERCADIVECLLYPGARSDSRGGIESTRRVDDLAFKGRQGHVQAVRQVCEAKACYPGVPSQSEFDKKNAFRSYHGKVGDLLNYLETIAIADLFACPFADQGQAGMSGLQVLLQAAEPLSVLDQLTAATQNGRHPLAWCLQNHVFMSVGIRLADLLSQSGTELPLLANLGCSASPQQQALYHAAALNMLQQAQPGAAPGRIYAAAGLSHAGVERLAHVAQCQFDVLKHMSERMMVALAETMFEQLLPACRQHTDSDAGVNVQALQASLGNTGLLAPLAHAVARSWQAALLDLHAQPLIVPPGATIGQARKILDDAMASGHPRHFAAILPAVLRQPELLAQFRALMTASPSSAGVLDHIFQVQCDQLRQYGEQLAQH
jgi:hypothetical protein